VLGFFTLAFPDVGVGVRVRVRVRTKSKIAILERAVLDRPARSERGADVVERRDRKGYGYGSRGVMIIKSILLVA
jgi:hypothetical protein